MRWQEHFQEVNEGLENAMLRFVDEEIPSCSECAMLDQRSFQDLSEQAERIGVFQMIIAIAGSANVGSRTEEKSLLLRFLNQTDHKSSY